MNRALKEGLTGYGIAQVAAAVSMLVIILPRTADLGDATGKEVGSFLFLVTIAAIGLLFGGLVALTSRELGSDAFWRGVKTLVVVGSAALVAAGAFGIYLDIAFGFRDTLGSGVLFLVAGVAGFIAGALYTNPSPGARLAGGVGGIVAASFFLAALEKTGNPIFTLRSTIFSVYPPVAFATTLTGVSLIVAAVAGLGILFLRDRRSEPAAWGVLVVAGLLLGSGLLATSVDGLSEDPWDGFGSAEGEEDWALGFSIAGLAFGLYASVLVLGASLLGLAVVGNAVHARLSEPMGLPWDGGAGPAPRQGRDTQAFRTCPECGNEVPTESQYCGQCGSEVPEDEPSGIQYCTECGMETEPEDKFCGGCGTRLVGESG